MIEWYDDEQMGILFSNEPHIDVLYPHPKQDNKDVCKKPFQLKNELKVILIDKTMDETYSFKIEKDYCWDGATIPRVFWRLIGSKTDNKFLIPSLIHDVLCENHSFVDNDRYFANKVFERLLYVSGVNGFSRWLMFHSVDNFQKFCAWGK